MAHSSGCSSVVGGANIIAENKVTIRHNWSITVEVSKDTVTAAGSPQPDLVSLLVISINLSLWELRRLHTLK